MDKREEFGATISIMHKGDNSLLKQDTIEKAVKPFIVDNRKKETPWQPLKKPLKECRVAIVTTAGVHLANQTPFDVDSKEGDVSYRELPVDTSPGDYRISHTHYDHSEADKDINTVFPIDRLKELAQQGFIKDLSQTNYGFMGFMQKSVFNQLYNNAKEIAQNLLKQETDLVLLTPG